MTKETRLINLALIGFGHVGRAFARLLLDRRAWFLREFGLEWKITGIATRNHGMCIDPNGLAVGKISPILEARIRTSTIPQRPRLRVDDRLRAPVRRRRSLRDEHSRPERRACRHLSSAKRCAPGSTWSQPTRARSRPTSASSPAWLACAACASSMKAR